MLGVKTAEAVPELTEPWTSAPTEVFVLSVTEKVTVPSLTIGHAFPGTGQVGIATVALSVTLTSVARAEVSAGLEVVLNTTAS